MQYSFPWLRFCVIKFRSVQFLNSKFLLHSVHFTIFKACVRYFLSIFFCTKWQSFKNHKKCFLFHLKSSFRSQDIQIFVFSSSPLFLPVSHCFIGWVEENLKVYEVINCLNKNLITHFVLYLEKEIRCDIETLSIDGHLRKIIQKMCTKG